VCPIGKRSIVISKSSCELLCISRKPHVRTLSIFYARSSVLLRRRCDTLRTSGFVADGMFSHNGFSGAWRYCSTTPLTAALCTLKLKFHGSSFLVASSWHLRENAANMPKEIGRVGRVGRGCYEDHREDVRNKSCVSGSWNLENDDTKCGQTGSIITAADRRPTNQVSA